MKEKEYIFNYPEMVTLYMDDEEMVRETLVYFKKKGWERLKSLKQAYNDKDFKKVEFESHALKGDARNLCACQLANHAEKIELATKGGRAAELDQEIDTLEKYLEVFNQEIVDYLY